jgi:hypothetical protein
VGFASEIKPVYEFLRGNSFAMPLFQRTYDWGPEQVKDLLEDISEFLYDEADEYFLGLITVRPDGTRKLQVVDGQQRLVTMTLLYAGFLRQVAANAMLPTVVSAAGIDEVSDLKRGIRSTEGEKPRIPMLDHAAEASYEKVLSLDVNWDDEETGDEDDETQLTLRENVTAEHLRVAAREIDSGLESWFKKFQTQKDTWEKARKITQGLKVLVLTVPENLDAGQVFHRMNSRGLRLSDADLVKARFVSQVADAPELHTKINKIWVETANSLLGAKLARLRSLDRLLGTLAGTESALQPLGQSVAIRRGGQSLDEQWERILKKDTEGQASSSVVVDKYLDQITKAARATVNFSAGTLNAANTDEFDPLLLVARRLRSSQHIAPLIAANVNSKWTNEGQYLLCQALDRKVLMSALGRERGQDVERVFAKWVAEIAKTPGGDKEKEIKAIKKCIGLTDATLVKNALDGFLERSYSIATHRRIIRLTLALLYFDNFSSLRKREDSLKLAKLANGKTFELDHIFPSSKRNELESGGDVAWVDRVGNLTLLEPPNNREARDSLPTSKEKLDWFNRSNIRPDNELLKARIETTKQWTKTEALLREQELQARLKVYLEWKPQI